MKKKKSLFEFFNIKESGIKPELKSIVDNYSKQVAEIDDPKRISDILSQMVVDLEQKQGEKPADVLQSESFTYQIPPTNNRTGCFKNNYNSHILIEAVNSKLYDLYRKHAATLETVKDLGELLRKLVFSIDNMNLDPGFSFEIQRAYDELLTVLEQGLKKKPEQPIVRPSKRGF